jgi:hypothetical protein
LDPHARGRVEKQTRFGRSGSRIDRKTGEDDAHLADEIEHDVLEDVAPVGDLLEVRHEEVHRPLLRVVVEHEEGVAPRAKVGLAPLEEALDGLGRVHEEHVAAGHLVNPIHAHHRVASHERMAVLEARDDGRDQRLQDLTLLDPAQETESGAAEELVRVLEVVAEVLADQDHLRQQLTLRVRLLDDLHVQQKELLHVLVLRREHEPHDGDENLGHLLAGQQDGYGFLHGLRLLVRAAGLERLLNLRGADTLVVVHQHGAPTLDHGVDGRHDHRVVSS